MRFSDTFLDEIRARLPVSAVVGRKVRLKKQGRELAGLSPFNSEKTPSFFVNDQKGKWFDFSAGKNGDIFTFLMETEGIGFPEAVEKLAAEAGVQLPARNAFSEEREKERASLYDVMDMAATFFEEALQSRFGAAARGYLGSRDLGPDLQRRFRIGYARADRAALKEHLAGKGITQEQMTAAGLLVTGDDIPVSFDRFRDRITFPIADFRGRIVGFGARALAADVPAKYLNSPETELFHKGGLLYNGAAARAAVRGVDTMIVVEGYVDVIRMVAAGFAATVAPLGTALTERQLQLLWAMTDEPTLCFDGDSAGIRAAGRAADLALPLIVPGKSLRFAALPEGQDPDDLIRARGADAMKAVIGSARPLVDLLWARETGGSAFDTPERRAALEARLREVARSFTDESVRRHYGQAFADRLSAFFPAPVRPDRGEWRGGDRRRGGAQPPARRPLSGRAMPVSDRLRRSAMIGGRAQPPLREAVLVVTMVNHPALLATHLDQFAHLDLSRDLDGLRSAILAAVADGDPEIRETVSARGFGPLLGRLEAQVEANGIWQVASTAADSDAAEGWLQALTLHARTGTLHRELKAAEAALADEPSDANLARLNDIRTELAKSEGTEALIEGFGASSGRQARLY
jgi:DNA primase